MQLRSALLPLALLALCALAWSGAVLRGGFAFDDLEVIESNPVVQGSAPLLAAFERDYWHHREDAGHYRPLASLSLRADHGHELMQPFSVDSAVLSDPRL